MINRHRDKTEKEIKDMFENMSNAEILKEYPNTIPTRLAAVIMNISDRDMRYGLSSNHPLFTKFGFAIPRKNRTEYKIDTKLFLENIPQRKGR